MLHWQGEGVVEDTHLSSEGMEGCSAYVTERKDADVCSASSEGVGLHSERRCRERDTREKEREIFFSRRERYGKHMLPFL